MSCSARLPCTWSSAWRSSARRPGTDLADVRDRHRRRAAGRRRVHAHVAQPDQTSAFVPSCRPIVGPHAARCLLIHVRAGQRVSSAKRAPRSLGASLDPPVACCSTCPGRDRRATYYGQVAHAISPVFAPLGFGDWGDQRRPDLASRPKSSSAPSSQVFGGQESRQPAANAGRGTLGRRHGLQQPRWTQRARSPASSRGRSAGATAGSSERP